MNKKKWLMSLYHGRETVNIEVSCMGVRRGFAHVWDGAGRRL
jgi:hypothetical protein